MTPGERRRAEWAGALSRALSATVAITLLVALYGALAGLPFLLRLATDGMPLALVQGAGLAVGVAALEAGRRRAARPAAWGWLQATLAAGVVAAGLAELGGLAGAGPD
ncbi:MAG: hypothetical protein LC623_03420, partial [Halobacteriales archaeon]|nr:hypothetical protein [Halobacteriales archaeon]